jgi:DNA-binding LacI/PurR family transcriptional regulator
VLNKTGNVSESTRNRVMEHIKAVGYVPTSSARMLKSKRTYTVGIVFTEELSIGLEHSFFSSILQHFKNYVEKEGYELSFIVKRLGKNELSYYQWCMNKRIDGVYIVVGNYNDKGLYELVNSPIPCVSTDMILDKLHTVICDNDQGIKISIDYAVNQLKQTHIGMISGPVSSKAFNERYVAFQKYMKQHHLTYQDSDIEFAESFGFTSGYRAMEQMIQKKKLLPKVLLVGSDDIALGVLKACKDYQLAIPKDIQIIGFDDISFAKHFTPPLTTIIQDRKLLGETAAKQLISLMEHPEIKLPEIVKLPVALVERETTKCAS